ncbi:piggyBac transposable element-derived protein 4-like [Ranitomeya imitator]|uniref:piggyBac transposable element-derived protein 4-like n=3 Tax=Ranitomeya imitator TaxID=111125 RepID=UPI0037E9AFA2
MSDSNAGSSFRHNPRKRVCRFTSDEIMRMLEESDSEHEDEPYVPSDDENYVPQVDVTEEDSDIEQEMVIEHENEYESDESVEDDSVPQSAGDIWTAKDETQWCSNPLPNAQTKSRNVLRQRGGPAAISNLYTAKELFKSIMTPEMCDIILRETNRKAKRVCDAYNNELVQRFPDSSKRPPQKTFKQFTETELHAFLGILIAAGVHRANKENLEEMWNVAALPLIRAAMSRDRFKMILRFIRFDNENTRAERVQTDKAAPIRDIWTMLNSNLERAYKPYHCITVDEQLFPFRGHTKFTQYIPSKPAKYGIKIFWACDSSNAYPLQGQLYTGKPTDGPRQVNIGERTVLDLVSSYKGSGRNVTTDNFFTTMELAKVLNSWNMTLVGTVRKNKRFLPNNMQPAKERPVYSTNFAYNHDATVCSYVPKKNKSVVLLSSMHMTGEVEETLAAKPEIIKYYNITKGGVDVMDKMLGEYTVKRRTSRWTLAFFYNMIDVSGLASYIIYREHNPSFRAKDQRRKFLKDLANQLCMIAIEDRSTNKMIMRNHFLRGAVEMVLGRCIVVASQPAAGPKIPHGSRGPSPVVGSCYVCRDLRRKQRKTRKSCVVCVKPICDEHSVAKPTCITCKENQ